MKKITIALFFCLLLFSNCQEHEDFTLNIVHVNDWHSYLLAPGQKDINVSNNKYLGGVSKIITFMLNEKQKNLNTICLYAGDIFTFTESAYYKISKSKYIFPLFKMIPFDAITLGNHELDNHLDLDDTRLFMEQNDTPIVVSNIELPFNNEISKSIILERKGRKIGIIGVTTTKLSDEVKVYPIKKCVKKEIENLKQQNINIIILLSHLGLKTDINLAKTFPEIDIIVGGHSHSLLSNNKHIESEGNYPKVVGNTLIVQSSSLGRYVGKLQVKFDENGNVTKYKGDSIPMNKKIKDNKDAKKIVIEALKSINLS